MKKIIIHSVPVAVSIIWLAACCQTLNPIELRGPGFLKFYLILVTGFYISVFCLRFFGEALSKLSFYFMFLIFILGIVKLIRGVSLDRPVGILFCILVAEIIMIVICTSVQLKNKINK
ncbi:hypothetical protein EG347_14445 [Chryseobacterium sp. G0186]|uniref:hypothetical protein n=1 Tax=Chryseobacterium sp. G0186 TaxID=2487064 RepID=UPI000F503E2B|nr:hypothetical protein [Chryseobacterium sp. G0186]AZA78623.1 hypothetical protein EG347_14445 [Chryseobacterium sp. G0186]